MRRRLVAIAAGAIATALVACSPSPSPSRPQGSTGPVAATSTPGPDATSSTIGATFDPNATPQPVAFEGLYVSSEVSVSGDATVAIVRSGMSCSALEHLVGAGEWSIVSRETVAFGADANASTMTVLSLENGSETALAWLAGGDICTARIARTMSAPLRISGAASVDAQAAVDVPFCVTTGQSVAFGAAYRTPSGPNVQVSVVAPARLGTTRLDPEDATLHISRGVMSHAQLAALLIQGFRDQEQGSFVEEYLPSEGARARLDVKTISPFTATLQLTGYAGLSGTIDIEVDMACHLPGGTLQRAADLAAVPAATQAPGTPGPTLAPFEGAAPGTVVITGTGIDGTYQLPAPDLDCYFDFDEGAWTIQTVGGADPTFYLYAYAGQAGGSSDQVSVGLIVGDGGNGRLFLFDTRVSPPDGTAQAQVAPSGGQVSVVLQARATSGATLAANLSCTGS